MNLSKIKAVVKMVAADYPIKKITMFGSRADNTNRQDSDLDLIVEFTTPVSLLTLSKLQLRLEEQLQLDVDIVHGPLQPGDILEVKTEVDLYVA